MEKAFGDDLSLATAILTHDRKATARLIQLHSDAVHRDVWKRLTPKIEMIDDIVQRSSWRLVSSVLPVL